jgi:intergrase/recombinase
MDNGSILPPQKRNDEIDPDQLYKIDAIHDIIRAYLNARELISDEIFGAIKDIVDAFRKNEILDVYIRKIEHGNLSRIVLAAPYLAFKIIVTYDVDFERVYITGKRKSYPEFNHELCRPHPPFIRAIRCIFYGYKPDGIEIDEFISDSIDFYYRDLKTVKK